jgi:hypothetical protein
MKSGEDGSWARGKGVARGSKKRAVGSSCDRPPGREAPAQGEAPTSGPALRDRAAWATEETQDQGRSLTEQYELLARTLKAELRDSRALRQDAASRMRADEPVLSQVKAFRDVAAWVLEQLRARGERKEAASVAFMVADFDNRIGRLEKFPESDSREIATYEAFEAEVGRTFGFAESAAGGREDTAAPARAHETPDDTAAAARAERELEEIGAFERAYAETGNPLYVWDALSVLCVHSLVPGQTPGRFLPGWCVDYLSRTAEVLLGLLPPGVHPAGGMAEQAPAVSKALGLSRQGWDAYAERQKDRARVRDADVYARVRALGIPDKDAMEAAIEYWGLKDERSVRHRLQRARRAKPRPTKPAP